MLKPAAFITLSLLLLSACSNLEFPGVYRLDIEQGNVITEEMVTQLKPGMSKSQVEFILGRALIRDPFSPDRWDYVYQIYKADRSIERRFLTVFFDEQDLMTRYTSSVAPKPEAEPEENGEASDGEEEQEEADS